MSISGIAQVLTEIWKIVQENMSAIGLLLFNYEEYKVMRANREKADALLALHLKENKDEIDKKYAGKSDDDVIADAIGDGTNSGDVGAKGTGDKGD